MVDDKLADEEVDVDVVVDEHPDEANGPEMVDEAVDEVVDEASSDGRPIRSMPTFIAGVVCIAVGLAAGIAELSTLTFGQSVSVTFLVGAVVVMGALIAQSRPR